MAIPHVVAGEVARAAEQNALIDLVNANTNELADHETRITSNTSAITSQGNRITTLEGKPVGTNAGAYFGQWTDNNAQGNGTGQTISGSDGVKITEFVSAVGTPTGCSISGGTVTINQAGLWLVTVSLQYTAGSSVRALWLSQSNAASGAGLAKFGSVAGPSMDVQSASAFMRFTAGQQVSAYAAIWQSGSPLNIWRARSNTITVAWLGP